MVELEIAGYEKTNFDHSDPYSYKQMYRRVLLPIFYTIVYEISTCIATRVSGIGYEHNCKILDIEDYHKKSR